MFETRGLNINGSVVRNERFQDAVAGTEKAHVDQDYRLRLHDSVVDCQQDVGNSYR